MTGLSRKASFDAKTNQLIHQSSVNHPKEKGFAKLNSFHYCALVCESWAREVMKYSRLHWPLAFFLLTLTGFADCYKQCGGNRTGFFGVIKTPNFPDSYPNHLRCLWNIKVAKGYRVGIRFTEFDIENFFECEYDWVKLVSGNKTLGRYCGNKNKKGALYTPSKYIRPSPSNQVNVIFRSDYSNEEVYRGFVLHYRALDVDECLDNNGGCDHFCHNYIGGYYCSCRSGYLMQNDSRSCNVVCDNQHLSARRSEISTPEFPREYPKNARCDWTILVDKGYQISLTFENFDVEDHQQVLCPYDYVQIQAGHQRRIGPLCGKTVPAKITSSGNYMHIEFVSDASGNYKGFKAHYETHGIRCPALKAPAHGNMSASTFTYKETVEFRCDNGYVLQGSHVRECLNTGQWDGQEAICKPVSCGYPGIPRHGNITEKGFTFLKTVNYTCDEFFRMQGDRSIQCQADGTWSGTLPRCLTICGKTKFFNASKSNCRGKIVGGHNADKGAYPWHVLLKKDGKVACGASMLNERWVLTAAHCVSTKNNANDRAVLSDPKKFKLYFGLHRTSKTNERQVQIRQVVQIQKHDKFEYNMFDSDLALLKLDREVDITPYVRPICLPETIQQVSLIQPNRNGMVAGWGATTTHASSTPDALKEVCLPAVRHAVCQNAYKPDNYVITQNMLCAGHSVGGRDSCHGDSGGGYVFHDRQTNTWVLGGVVSWGSEHGCGLAGKYGVYVKMSNAIFIRWVYEKMV